MKAAVWCVALVLATARAERSLGYAEAIRNQVQHLEVSPDGRAHVVVTGYTYQRYSRENNVTLSVHYETGIMSLTVDANGSAYITVLHFTSPDISYTLHVLKADSDEFELWFSGIGIPRTFKDSENFIYLLDSDGVSLVRPDKTKATIEGLGTKLLHYNSDAKGNAYFFHGYNDSDYRMAVLEAAERAKPTPRARELAGVLDPEEHWVTVAAVNSFGSLFLGTYYSLKEVTPNGSAYFRFPQGTNAVAVDRHDTTYFTTNGDLDNVHHEAFTLPPQSQFPVQVPGLSNVPDPFLDILVDSQNNVFFAREEAVSVLSGGTMSYIGGFGGVNHNFLLDTEDTLVVVANLGTIYYVPQGATTAVRVRGRTRMSPPYLMANAPDTTVYFGTDLGLYYLLPDSE